MNEHWRNLQDIFDEICLLDEDMRRGILEERCQDDAGLRSEVERLVRAYDQERAANAEASVTPGGRRFGVWQTIHLIARGGMGEVWLARRADGQHEQQAALKILSPYLAASDSVDRFRRERQLLARLEHPNIARLLDGGMSPLGEPYLVMEYVEGIRLDRYCEHRQLSIQDRLLLFLKVCAAVAAAHQYLVVHRDLKPGNILVTADGEPKLLDFGIAKLIDVEAGLQQTATANIFLTPMYASPEILRGQPVSIGSDIYSLGVILYEMLAGRRPFDGSRLSPAALVEAVTEKDPALPSSACADQKLKTALRGDLDSIALKALARNPDERYHSVAQLADDVTRHLDGQPVVAVQGSGWYVVRKFVRRNALAVSAAAVLLLSLAAGLAGTLWQARVARQERTIAEQRFNDARQLANYLLFDLYDSVGKIPGTMPVQADMARRTLEYLDRMAAIKSNDPSLRLELAQGYHRLGALLSRGPNGDTLGHNAQAVEIERKALALVEPLAAERPSDLATRRTLAAIQGELGAALSLTGQYKEALTWLQKSAQTFDDIARSRPDDLKSLEDAGQGWQVLGKLLSEKGGYIAFNAVAPLEYLNKSVRYLEAALRLNPANAVASKTLAETYVSIGRIDSMPNPSQGAQDYSRGLDVLARLRESERESADTRNLRTRLLVLLGWNQGQLGRLKESLATFEAARPLLDSQAAADPQNMGAEYRRVELYRSLGLVYGYAGDSAASLVNLQKALSILESIMKRDTANALYPVLRAELQGRVATLLLHAGRSAEAYPYAQASVAYFKNLGEKPDATPGQLIEAVRSTAENALPSLRDYPAALRFALRADRVAGGKDPAALGYLAEAYALNKELP